MGKLVDCIKMRFGIDFIIERDGKLLERMHMGIYLLTLVFQAIGKCSGLGIQASHCCHYQKPFDFRRMHHNLSSWFKNWVHENISLHLFHLFFKSLNLKLLGFAKIFIGDLPLIHFFQPMDLCRQLFLSLKHLFISHGRLIPGILRLLKQILLLKNLPKEILKKLPINLRHSLSILPQLRGHLMAIEDQLCLE